MKQSIGVILLAMVFVLAGCSDSNPVGTSSQDSFSAHSIMNASGPFETSDLIAGQNTKVGHVSVEDKGNGIVDISYNITAAGWCISEWHLHVASSASGVPQTRNGNPIPGQFAYSGKPGCVITATQEGIQKPSDPFVVAAHAVVKSGSESDYVYGITNAGGVIYLVDLANEVSTLVFDTGLGSPDINWPNGLAYDDTKNRLYYAGDQSEDNRLRFIDVADPNPVIAGFLKYRSAGSTYHNGAYYYIPHNLRPAGADGSDRGDDLRRVVFNADGTIGSDQVVIANFTGKTAWTRYQFGDLAAKGNMIYFHGEDVEASPRTVEFSTLNLDTGDYNIIKTGYAEKLQLAFNADKSVLYGHATDSGRFYEVDLATGDISFTGFTDRRYNDLASAPMLEAREETAWGFGTRFVTRGNWATWFWWPSAP